MKNITKIKLLNFKRFSNLEMEFNDNLNILIGDNEAGKSSILTAIDLVLSGSRHKVETLGLESLFTKTVIASFLSSMKKYNDLPKLIVELYLNDQQDADLNGRINTENRVCDGLQLCCEPDQTLSHEIKQVLSQPGNNFPFEYYSINFKTFADQNYSGYRRHLKYVLIDSSQINNEYATKEYVKNMYLSSSTDIQRCRHFNEYRKHKGDFTTNVLSDVNSSLPIYQFGVRSSTKTNLATDLTLNEDNINIENKGKGKQCFIKTAFALHRTGFSIDVILLEEPENHLSHLHMKKLIDMIKGANDKQLFISTHSNLISTRLDLRKTILINSSSTVSSSLKNLTESTAKFFMKAPDNNVLEFVLSNKVILVEGDAEYILMNQFSKNTVNMTLDELGVHVISVDGTSFKRYMELAASLGIKTALIRDNDNDFQTNCVDNYKNYSGTNIQVFADKNNQRSTFEICLYEDNKALCNRLFAANRKTLTVQEYMLKNKTEAAFQLLDNDVDNLATPDHIKRAIEWIKK